MKTRTAAAWLSGCAAAAAIAAIAFQAGTWEQVLAKDGVTVDMKSASSGEVPSFRARATMTARPVEVLAVLQDVDRHCEWAPNCTRATLVQQVTPTSRYTYSRSDPSWPASPRDLVLFTEFRILEDGQHIRSSFEARPHPKAPPVDGVIRITSIAGHYELRRTSDGQTRVEYLVSSDPGGKVPAWLVSRHGASVPFDTLRGLRSQVRKTRGEYADFLALWN